MTTQHATVLDTLHNMIEDADIVARGEEVELFRGKTDGSEAHLDSMATKRGVSDPWLELLLTDGTRWRVSVERIK